MKYLKFENYASWRKERLEDLIKEKKDTNDYILDVLYMYEDADYTPLKNILKKRNSIPSDKLVLRLLCAGYDVNVEAELISHLPKFHGITPSVFVIRNYSEGFSYSAKYIGSGNVRLFDFLEYDPQKLHKKISDTFKKVNYKMKPKFNFGDVVEWQGHRGTVYIIDANGTFEQHEYPSYDILTQEALYKHIQEPSLKLVAPCPIKNHRIVSDKTFARRLLAFLKEVKVFDLPGLEEQNYLVTIAKQLVEYQDKTARDKEEIDYIKRLKK